MISLLLKAVNIKSYGTEPAVGRAVKKSGIPREEIFITTKLWNNSHKPGDVEKALDASLSDLETDYVDLFLIHWPVSFLPGETFTPRDSNGKVIVGDTDYVDVWKRACFRSRPLPVVVVGVTNEIRLDMESLGEDACERQDEGHRNFKLLPQGD